MRRLAALLLAATAAVYWQVGGHDFVGLDDPTWVVENERVQSGLSWENARWAFTTFYASNWLPLTWLSLQLDAELQGPGPAGFHRTNLALHLLATLGLYLALARLSGARGRSLFVAALFALHPQQVESVAWVTERKDVLSGLFWMLALYAYALYAERPASAGRYAALLACLALGLMAKPMLVTLPFVLLLLDYWPLGRLGREPLRRLLLEKIPLLLLVLVASALTLWAQRAGGAIRGLEEVALGARVTNALVAYVSYLAKFAWPTDLAAFYPHRRELLPLGQALAAGALLLAVSAAVARAARARPYLAVGWLWYLGTLLPVIGLVQVGSHARADRYTYLPQIGLAIALAWGGCDLARALRLPPLALRALALAAVAALVPPTWLQVRTWRDSLALWEHAARVTSGNVTAHFHYARLLAEGGRPDEAAAQYRAALAAEPSHLPSRFNLGQLLFERGELAEGLAVFAEGARLRPENPDAQFNLGAALLRLERPEEALAPLLRAVELEPDHAPAHLALALVHPDPARRADHLDRALRAEEGYDSRYPLLEPRAR